jgi:hypothetical protein
MKLLMDRAGWIASNSIPDFRFEMPVLYSQPSSSGHLTLERGSAIISATVSRQA